MQAAEACPLEQAQAPGQHPRPTYPGALQPSLGRCDLTHMGLHSFPRGGKHTTLVCSTCPKNDRNESRVSSCTMQRQRKRQFGSSPGCHRGADDAPRCHLLSEGIPSLHLLYLSLFLSHWWRGKTKITAESDRALLVYKSHETSVYSREREAAGRDSEHSACPARWALRASVGSSRPATGTHGGRRRAAHRQTLELPGLLRMALTDPGSC